MQWLFEKRYLSQFVISISSNHVTNRVQLQLYKNQNNDVTGLNENELDQ